MNGSVRDAAILLSGSRVTGDYEKKLNCQIAIPTANGVLYDSGTSAVEEHVAASTIIRQKGMNYGVKDPFVKI